MKWSITYFYNVRHMKPSQLPLSTAMFPPTWFSKGKDGSGIHLDNNNVINGLTIASLVPMKQCECPCKKKDYAHCKFLKTYAKQLQKVDFNHVIEEVEFIAKQFHKFTTNLPEIDEVVLLVFEKPDNPCSERTVLKAWFKEHGIELNEMKTKHESN